MSKCEDCIHSVVCFKRSMKESLEPQGFELECHRFVSKDVVEVVRCKDCVCFNNNMPTRPFCDYFGAAIDLMHFCSYGERKDS